MVQSVRTEIISLTDPELDSGLYSACLRLRHDVFISKLGWNLYSHLGCEFDQYDTPASLHVVATQGDSLLGCMRLLRTDNQQGASTYMILDAHRGQIPNLPPNIMQKEIVSDRAWEASRIAISRFVPGRERNSVFLNIVAAGAHYVSERGGDTLLGLMNPVFRRVFQRGGFNVENFGPIAEQRDGAICVLKMDTREFRARAA